MEDLLKSVVRGDLKEAMNGIGYELDAENSLMEGEHFTSMLITIKVPNC